MADRYVPWRHHSSLSIQNFEFPLWNAHQMGGYPIHADPQSGVFYPIVWLFSIFPSGYTIFSAHAEFILTVSIAACCFYKLCRYFKLSRETALLADIVYAGGGIFVGNSQHITWVISAAYLPGIFYCFFSLGTQLKYKYSLALAGFIFLLLTGGYSGFDIILDCLLVVFYGYFGYQQYKSSTLLAYSKLLSLSFFLTVAMSSAFIYSVYTVLSF